MPKTEKTNLPAEKTFGFVDYIPATVKHNAHGWSIEYHAYDPTTGKLKRHAVKLNVLRKNYARVADFKAHVNRICVQINGQLAGGWTPFGESRNARMLMPVRMVADIYIKEKGSDNYRPIDPERIYTLASFNYLIKELGGEGCLRYATLQEDNLGKDVNILAAYIEQNLKGHIGQPYEQAEGRITIK